jgi:hypothetical protein
VKETHLHSEILAALRGIGAWATKIPDTPVYRPGAMGVSEDGGMRFSLPKPFDLVGCLPGGRFLAIECKLVKAQTLRADARLVKQFETLRSVARRDGFAALVVNFRVDSTRAGKINRCFLCPAKYPEATFPIEGSSYSLAAIAEAPWTRELTRRAGGWTLPAGIFAP